MSTKGGDSTLEILVLDVRSANLELGCDPGISNFHADDSATNTRS